MPKMQRMVKVISTKNIKPFDLEKTVNNFLFSVQKHGGNILKTSDRNERYTIEFEIPEDIAQGVLKDGTNG